MRHTRRNIRKFPVPNDIGQYDFRNTPMGLLNDPEWYDYPLCMDQFRQRYPGYLLSTRQSGYGHVLDKMKRKRKFVYIKEMEPELIVPDLTDFKLKPYVSYRTSDIQQSEFTAKALFNIVYGRKMVEKFHNGEEVTPIEHNEEETHQARIKAMQTGADLFVGGSWYDSFSRDIKSDEQLQKEWEEEMAIWRKYGKTTDSRKMNKRVSDNPVDRIEPPPLKLTK